jgi:hypothetical protein
MVHDSINKDYGSYLKYSKYGAFTLNRMTRRLEKNTGKYAGRGSVTARGKCGEGGSMELLSVISVLRMSTSLPLPLLWVEIFFILFYLCFM